MRQRWAFFAEYNRRLQLLYFFYGCSYNRDTYLYVVLDRLSDWMDSYGIRWYRKWDRIDSNLVIIRGALGWWFNCYQCWWWFERIKWSLDFQTKSNKFWVTIRSERCCLLWIHNDYPWWMFIGRTVWPKHNRRHRLLYRCYWTIYCVNPYLHSIIGSLLSWLDTSSN